VSIRTFLCSILLTVPAWAAPAGNAPLANPFFAFCMDTHDSMKRSLEEQASLLKELGYDGAGHLWLDDLEKRIETLDAAGLQLFQVYFQVNVSATADPPYDPRLDTFLPLLKGRNLMLALLMTGLPPSEASGDARGVKLIQEIADKARPFGVKVALYPHSGDWLERVEDGLRLVRLAGRENVGVMFNLCHWLKVDEESRLEALLEEAAPHLYAVSIHGADSAEEIQSGSGNWIQPLGSGSFDILHLLKLLDKTGFRGPVGLQCYGLTGDARDHLSQSIAAWHTLNAQRDPR
jgi:sugar phosphate isomerase/epimerase